MQHTFKTLVTGETTQEDFDNMMRYQLIEIAEQCGANLKNGTGIFIKMDIIAKIKEARANINK